MPVAKPPELAQVGLPDAAEIARILVQFRQTGIAGDYYLEFELRALPRRGDEQTFRGKMWGSRNDEGAITRVALTDAAKREHRLLVQNGGQPSVWRLTEPPVVQLDAAAVFEPLVPGVNLTAFDLQMPFLYWPGVTLEKITRMRGRPAHVFVFRPPAAFAAKNPRLGAVRAYLDTQYNAPTQIETIDPQGRVTRTLSLLELKKVGEQWIPQSFEVRDEVSRDKTRLNVTAAALNLALPSAVFAPAGLADEVRPPAAERIFKLAP
ncbi:MAG: outer membrane lipoprotein-sorting protein [Verrucomicrobia bacterium]|nr:outer membrane lipoprotein-sorting protein [Verrucomicrobiota bacterium]